MRRPTEKERERHRLYMRESRRLKREGRWEEEVERRRIERLKKTEQIESPFLKQQAESKRRRQLQAETCERLKREIAQIRWRPEWRQS